MYLNFYVKSINVTEYLNINESNMIQFSLRSNRDWLTKKCTAEKLDLCKNTISMQSSYLAMFPIYGMMFLTKFHKDVAKIVNSLVMANF